MTVLSESFPTFGKFVADDVIALFYQQAQRRWFAIVNYIFFGKPSEGLKPSEGYMNVMLSNTKHPSL
jgi:hypothetical protein